MKTFKLKVNGKWIIQKAWSIAQAVCKACRGLSQAIVLVMCCLSAGKVEFIGARIVL